jgi:shikimate-5-dehydrogenase
VAVARRAAVLGSPIAHSLSPVLHLAAYRALGLSGWQYEAIDCDEAALPGLLDSLGPEWAGLSLTMPLKRTVLPLLDQADQLSADVGAANTVVFRGEQRLGYNTDVPGIVAAMRDAGVTSQGNVVVLGSGATACSAVAALAGTGASRIAVAVRALKKARPLTEVAARLGVAVDLIELGPELAATRWELLISTIPAAGAEPVAKQLLAGNVSAAAVFDVVYDPWPAPLAAAAEKAGATVISGFELLVQQAVGQVELMTGLRPPVEAMRAAGLAELERRRALR